MALKSGMERKLHIDIYLPYLSNIESCKFTDASISVNKKIKHYTVLPLKQIKDVHYFIVGCQQIHFDM